MRAPDEPEPGLLLGIFVGGRARRMGGVAKGLLPAPEGGGSLVERLVLDARALVSDVVLVGRHPSYEALGASLRAPFLDDAAEGRGPLGGLVALLEHARGRPVLALACDMPRVDRALLLRLAHEHPEAPALAPRRNDRWEPLCARYGAAVLPLARARLDGGQLGLQRLLDAVGARELLLGDDERARLEDWDRPEDLPR